jgi:hypothetical protein
MKKQESSTNIGIVIIAVVIAIALSAVGFAWIIRRYIRPAIYYVSGADVVQGDEFPEINEEELSPNQKAIIDSARRVWQEPRPESFYTDVPQNEPWCANFVSYVYREAGLPFTNPVAGGWRIPGIYTLTDYLELENYWHPADSGYVPVAGDIVIYDHGVLSGHTNIVLKVEGDQMTTIGGNENKAIHIRTINYKDSKFGIQGFGHVE